MEPYQIRTIYVVRDMPEDRAILKVEAEIHEHMGRSYALYWTRGSPDPTYVYAYSYTEEDARAASVKSAKARFKTAQNMFKHVSRWLEEAEKGFPVRKIGIPRPLKKQNYHP